MELAGLSKILFLDIETVSAYEYYHQLPEGLKKNWDKKAGFIDKSGELSPEELYSQAGIYAEYGKIVCISIGYIAFNKEIPEIRIKSYFGENEKKILSEFSNTIRKYFNNADNLLCGHNGKEFDFPYICRRMLVNKIQIPAILDISGKKPWEINLLDTMEMWKFGDYKNFVSLDLLANIFEIPTSKDDIDGSQVRDVYYKEKNLERIVNYCQKDVYTLIRVFLRLKGLNDEEFSKVEYL